MRKMAWVFLLCFLLLQGTMTVWAAPVRQNGPILNKQLGVSKLTLTVPGIGETWRQGTAHKIAWTYKGHALANDKVKIELFYAEKLVGTLATDYTIGSNGMGSFKWIIPDNQPIGAAYSVVITSEKDAKVIAKSNMFFIDYGFDQSKNNTTNGTVNDSPLSLLEITAPKGGDAWPPVSGYKIIWTYDVTRFNSTTVKILLLKGGKVVQTVSAWNTVGINGKGEAPPSSFDLVPAGSDYQVKVIGLDSHRQETDQYAISGYFTITEAGKVKIIEPHDGQVFHYGQHVPISWNYSGDVGKTIRIYVWDGKMNEKTYQTINVAAPIGQGGHGSIDWQVPDSLPAGLYQIYIDSILPYSYKAVSEWFTIGKVNKVITTPAKFHIPKPGETVELNPQPEPPEKQHKKFGNIK